MGRQRQPTDLVLLNGRKHLTKAEIEDRRSSEVAPLIGKITPPKSLTPAERKEFKKIAKQLQELGVLSQTDEGALERYVQVHHLFLDVQEQLKLEKIRQDPELLDAFLKNQDRLFRQCRQAASDLGLTISSRCRLVVPKAAESPPENKFAKFKKVVD